MESSGVHMEYGGDRQDLKIMMKIVKVCAKNCYGCIHGGKCIKLVNKMRSDDH